MAYNLTIYYYFEYYNSSLLQQTCVTLNKICRHVPLEHYNSSLLETCVTHTTQHLCISVSHSTINNSPSSVPFWSLVASSVSITHLFYWCLEVKIIYVTFGLPFSTVSIYINSSIYTIHLNLPISRPDTLLPLYILPFH